LIQVIVPDHAVVPVEPTEYTGLVPVEAADTEIYDCEGNTGR
jgi:hypothetical protein